MAVNNRSCKHLSEADVALGVIIFIDHYVKITLAELENPFEMVFVSVLWLQVKCYLCTKSRVNNIKK